MIIYFLQTSVCKPPPCRLIYFENEYRVRRYDLVLEGTGPVVLRDCSNRAEPRPEGDIRIRDVWLGVIPVHVRIGKTKWKTSLFPKDERYLVPIKASVRKAENLAEGDKVTIRLEVR